MHFFWHIFPKICAFLCMIPSRKIPDFRQVNSRETRAYPWKYPGILGGDFFPNFAHFFAAIFFWFPEKMRKFTSENKIIRCTEHLLFKNFGDTILCTILQNFPDFPRKIFPRLTIGEVLFSILNLKKFSFRGGIFDKFLGEISAGPRLFFRRNFDLKCLLQIILIYWFLWAKITKIFDTIFTKFLGLPLWRARGPGGRLVVNVPYLPKF